jgi:hypothetical protein
MPKFEVNGYDHNEMSLVPSDYDVKNEGGMLWTWMSGSWTNPVQIVDPIPMKTDIEQIQDWIRECKNKRLAQETKDIYSFVLQEKYPDLKAAAASLAKMTAIFESMERDCVEKEEIVKALS